MHTLWKALEKCLHEGADVVPTAVCHAVFSSPVWSYGALFCGFCVFWYSVVLGWVGGSGGNLNICCLNCFLVVMLCDVLQ